MPRTWVTPTPGGTSSPSMTGAASSTVELPASNAVNVQIFDSSGPPEKAKMYPPESAWTSRLTRDMAPLVQVIMTDDPAKASWRSVIRSGSQGGFAVCGRAQIPNGSVGMPMVALSIQRSSRTQPYLWPGEPGMWSPRATASQLTRAPSAWKHAGSTR